MKLRNPVQPKRKPKKTNKKKKKKPKRKPANTAIMLAHHVMWFRFLVAATFPQLLGFENSHHGVTFVLLERSKKKMCYTYSI